METESLELLAECLVANKWAFLSIEYNEDDGDEIVIDKKALIETIYQYRQGNL